MNAIVRQWPRLAYTSGTLEALKWFAVVCMVLDHTNRALFGYELGSWAEFLGRLAFPIFAVVFGYNLARPKVDHPRIVVRLAAWSVVAAVFYVPLFGAWPWNVLLTLSVAAFVVAWLRGWYAWWEVLPSALVMCFVVDYLAPGLALVLAAHAYARRPSLGPVAVALSSIAAICALMGNLYAFAALPLLAFATRIDIALPRSRSAFLWVYVAHLGALLLLVGIAHG